MVTISELRNKGVILDCFYIYTIGFCYSKGNLNQEPIICNAAGYKMIVEQMIGSLHGHEIKVRVNDSLQYIGDYAFYLCVKLRSFPLLEGLLEIGEGSFSGCCSLEIKSLPSTLEEIGKGAFNECKLSPVITIPPKIKIIREETFKNTYNLKEIHIPSSVKVIEDNAFKNCGSLEKVYLSKNTKVSSTAFYNCNKAKFYYV